MIVEKRFPSLKIARMCVSVRGGLIGAGPGIRDYSFTVLEKWPCLAIRNHHSMQLTGIWEARMPCGAIPWRATRQPSPEHLASRSQVDRLLQRDETDVFLV
jgi:hypothetical protein